MLVGKLFREPHVTLSLFAVIITVITVVALLAVDARGQNLPAQSWQSPLRQEHSLVGKIWDSKNNRYIGRAELLNKAGEASYLLLGEKHDNADHHAIQQWLLSRLLAGGDVGTVSFEMMSTDTQEKLTAIAAPDYRDLTTLNAYLEWDNKGWEWDYYGPLIMSALNAGTAVFAANINPGTMMSVYQSDSSPELSSVLEPEMFTQLSQDIDESHCGKLPSSQFPAMVRVQQARDSQMAASMMAGEKGDGTNVLIAGNYHIRHDLAVPNYLLAQNEQTARSKIVVIAAIEVIQGVNEPSDYLERYGSLDAYDYIWFTPALTDKDYCADID